MIILPAIDIKDGCCVRLRRGDFATAHKVAEDAVQTAAAFSTAGAAWIHMVDLDGAKEGGAKNEHIFLEVARHSGLRVELGGGIRDMSMRMATESLLVSMRGTAWLRRRAGSIQAHCIILIWRGIWRI